jgi:hypothetical protein
MPANNRASGGQLHPHCDQVRDGHHIPMTSNIQADGKSGLKNNQAG